MSNYNICYSLDNAYFEQLATSIASILKNSKEKETFSFYVLHSGVDKNNIEKIALLKQIKDFNIEFIKLEKEDFEACPLLNKSNDKYKDYHVTIPTYYRFKLASVFQNLDKILYLDCDVLIKDSLAELINTDLADNYAGMVLDVETENESERLGISNYYNAGVILVNLKKWREDNIEDKLFQAIEKYKNIILWQDQDIINLVFNEKIKTLPRKWNFQYFLYDETRYNGLFENIYKYVILHFAGKYKPWENKTSHPLFQEYYTYLALTPWKNRVDEVVYSRFEKLINEKRIQLAEDICQFKKELKQNIEKHLQNSQDDKYIALARNLIDEKNNNLAEEILKKTDVIISDKENKLYQEISKNYDYTSSLNNQSKNEISQDFLQKIENIEQKIQDTFDFSKIKTDEIFQNISNNEKNVYQEIDKRFNLNESELVQKEKDLYEAISKVYEFINKDFQEAVDSKFLQSNDAMCLKEKELYDAVSKTYVYTDSKMSEKEQVFNNSIKQVYEHIQKTKDDLLYNEINNEVETAFSNINNELNKKYEEAIKSSELNLLQQKEVFNRLIDTKTENLQNFFENAIKTQLDLIKILYENDKKNIIKNYEEKILNQKTYYEDLLSSKLEIKHQWAENQLQSQANWYEEEMKRRLQEKDDWHIQNYKKMVEEKETILSKYYCDNEQLNKEKEELNFKNENLSNQVKERDEWLSQKDIQIENERIKFEKRIKPIKLLVKIVDKLRKVKSQIKKKIKR